MPMHWKLLFTGQSLIFTLAIWVRQQDVEQAKRLQDFQDDKKEIDDNIANKDMAREEPVPVNK